MNISKLFKLILYFCIVLMASLVIVPFLGAIVFAFGIVTLVSMPIGIIRTFFDVSWISMNLNGYVVPQSLSILVSLIIFLINFAFVFVSYKLLKKYIRFVIGTYTKLNK